jgi:mono/diheme cytochrome c family protein
MPILPLWFLILSQVASQTDDAIDFQRDIQPIFQKNCLSCHGSKARGGLRLDQARLILSGGESGLAVAPGKPDASLLLRKLSSKDPAERMPPEGQPLPTSDIAKIKSWIASGAKIPTAGSQETWWAFKPLSKPLVPQLAEKNSIDSFVRQKLREKGWELSAPASKAALLRRVTFDLTGLPPSVDELNHFLQDQTSGAYEKVVDRLLASPAYGERWARLWLDLVHYADTHGYDKDKLRNNAWPYRDHLIPQQ